MKEFADVAIYNLIKQRFFYNYYQSWYYLYIMRQTAGLVFNPIMVDDYAALFSCTAVVQAWDSMAALMLS